MNEVQKIQSAIQRLIADLEVAAKAEGVSATVKFGNDYVTYDGWNWSLPNNYDGDWYNSSADC